MSKRFAPKYNCSEAVQPQENQDRNYRNVPLEMWEDIILDIMVADG